MTAATHLPASPATTVLTITAATVQAGEHVQTLPFNLIAPSTLNPRKAFDQAALTELAQNIYERTARDEHGHITASGIIQNLLARPTERGTAELAAGERRYRAVKLLVEGLNIQVRTGTDPNGQPIMSSAFVQVPDTYPMPVLVQDMTDADLIEAATVENVQRADMTPMEEADAYMALLSAGRTEDYIALRYGKHPTTVRNRIQLAAGLGKEGRKLLQEDKISLDTAKLIAGSTGELKKLLLERARMGSNTETLRYLVKRAGFMVEYALFDVQASGLHFEVNLLGDMPQKFSNFAAAMKLQRAALEAKKAEAEASGEWKEVVIVGVEESNAALPTDEWVNYYSVPGGYTDLCLVMVYCAQTGYVREYENVARKAAVKEFERNRRAQPGTAHTVSASEEGKGVREAAHVTAHQTRSEALDAYHAANPKATLALACVALAQSGTLYSSTKLMGLRTDERKAAPITPETKALAAQIAARFPIFTTNAEGTLGYADRASVTGPALLDALTHESVTEADLTLIFAYFTHRTVGAWAHNTNRPSRDLNAYAARIGADTEVQRRFTLTPEFLNAYTSADLNTIVQGMPAEARPTYKHSASKKEMVGAIMEKASALKDAGWLPEIVKFK